MTLGVVARTVVSGAAAPVPSTLVAPRDSDVVPWSKESILFSACNEDSDCELRAFGSLEGQRVMCVTAGGGRVLNLLVARPREIWAVDLNPGQNALLELKIAAMRELDHDAFLRFLGARDDGRRESTYERLRPRLSRGASNFFDARIEQVQDGVLMQGRLERFFSRISRLLRVGHPLGIDKLFACDDLAVQRRMMATWDTWLWRTLAENLCRRWVMRVFSGDPGFYRHVPEHMPLHKHVYEGVHRFFWNHLARDNALLQLVFFGRYVYEPAMPIYLNARTFAEVKAALEDVHIETVTAMVDDALRHAGPNAFDAYSLSDISSYLDDRAHDGLFEHVLRTARPGARLCSRSNIHHRPLSAEHAARVRRNAALERTLAIDDHSCVHEFLTGVIE